MKEEGALDKSKGMSVHSYNPSLVLKPSSTHPEEHIDLMTAALQILFGEHTLGRSSISFRFHCYYVNGVIDVMTIDKHSPTAVLFQSKDCKYCTRGHTQRILTHPNPTFSDFFNLCTHIRTRITHWVCCRQHTNGCSNSRCLSAAGCCSWLRNRQCLRWHHLSPNRYCPLAYCEHYFNNNLMYAVEELHSNKT